MAANLSDDERLARQLQQEEYQTAQMGTAQGAQMGIPVGGVAGTGTPVVQGMAVQGQQPVAIGMVQPGMMPYNVAVVPDIPHDEAVVLNYRFSMQCFCMIDAVSTALNAASFIRTTFEDNNEEEKISVFGIKGLIEDENVGKILGLCGLLLLIGPLCGFIGARKFNRSLIAIYLIFCIIKTIFEIALAVLTMWLWYILIALVQIWVTKIVFTFWTALGRIPEDRIKLLQSPDYMQNVRPRIVYW